MKTPNSSLKSVLCLVLLAGAAWCQTPPATLAAMRAASRSQRCEPPTEAQMQAATDLFRRLFAGEREGEKVSSLCRALSYEIVPVVAGEETVLVLREMEDARKGRGLFAFRVSAPAPECAGAGAPKSPAPPAASTEAPPPPIALQAPHSYYDRHTGEIAERLFLEHPFTAAAWNTAHRYAAADGSSDLCHTDRSLLSSFTRAFVTAFPKGIIVQVHGFAGSKLRSPDAAAAGGILSNGTPAPPRWVKGAAACLADHFTGPMLTYPDDIQELGATENEQGRLLRTLGRGSFLHIEFSLPARQLLKGDENVRRHLWNCLREIGQQ
jgi:hypothetical protein